MRLESPKNYAKLELNRELHGEINRIEVSRLRRRLGKKEIEFMEEFILVSVKGRGRKTSIEENREEKKRWLGCGDVDNFV